VYDIKWIIIYFNSKLLRMMCNQEAAIESWTAQLHFVCMRDGGVDDSYRIEDTGKRQNGRRRREASTIPLSPTRYRTVRRKLRAAERRLRGRYRTAVAEIAEIT
jgi:hypothetical protein